MEIKCAHDKMVETVSLNDNPLNANTHSESQIQLYADILKFQGIRKPIVVSNQSGFIVTGHGLKRAALINGWHKVPVNYQDFESTDQEYAHCVADNELGRKSRTDYGRVNANVENMGPDLDLKYLALESFELEPADKKRTNNAPAPNPGKGVNSQTISFQCTSDQAEIVRAAMKKASELYPDFSSKARAMTAICKQFLDLKSGQ